MSEIVRYPEKAEELGILINAERQIRGLKPLYMFPYLNECAMERAEEISEFYSHYRPNGDWFSEIIDYKVVQYSSIFENISGGFETSEEMFEGWLNSADHRNAMLNANTTHMGIGLVYNPNGVANVGWYWCAIFTKDNRANYEYEGQYLPENSENPEIIGAFENAEKLRKIIIPESVKKIGAKSFSGTLLSNVKIAENCEYSANSFPENCTVEFY